MKVGILTIGNELTSGKTQDTNSSFIVREVNRQGWEVAMMMAVGDDTPEIGKALAHILAAADAVIVTGGLGPTADDITTDAIAAAFGLKLYTDETALEKIRQRFAKRNYHWTGNNAKQAMFPEGAEPIANPVGTAWGFSLKRDGKIVAVMPGVPVEARQMLTDGVIPRLRREFPHAARHVAVKIIKLSGIGESSVDQILAPVDFAGMGVALGSYPNFPEIQLALTARDADQGTAEERVRAAAVAVTEKLKKHIFAFDGDTLEGVVAALLTEKHLTLAVAESCTGGLITDRLTDVPGSSLFLERAAVTYSNLSKSELLGVPEEVIGKFGAVSRETAILMAEGVRRIGHTDLGLAATGIAGPSGGTDVKPVGTVFIALADGRTTVCRDFLLAGGRRRIKVAASQFALILLKDYLSGHEHG
jgi:nicotinamide-nucleotide amidase